MILRLFKYRLFPISSLLTSKCYHSVYPSRMFYNLTISNSFHSKSILNGRGRSLNLCPVIDRAISSLYRVTDAKMFGMSSLFLDIKGKQLMKTKLKNGHNVRYLSSSLPRDISDMLQEGVEIGLERKELDLSSK